MREVIDSHHRDPLMGHSDKIIQNTVDRTVLLWTVKACMIL